MRSKRWWIEAACLSAVALLSIPARGHRGHRAVHVDFADNLTVRSDGLNVTCGLETFDYTDEFDPGCSGSLGQVVSHSHANDDWDFRTAKGSTTAPLRSLRLDFSGAASCPSLPTDVFNPVPGTACEFTVQAFFLTSARILYLPSTQIPFELTILKYDGGFWKSVYLLEFDGGATVTHNGADNAVLANVDTINCSATLYQLAAKGASKKIQPPVASLPMCFSAALKRAGATTQ